MRASGAIAVPSCHGAIATTIAAAIAAPATPPTSHRRRGCTTSSRASASWSAVSKRAPGSVASARAVTARSRARTNRGTRMTPTGRAFASRWRRGLLSTTVADLLSLEIVGAVAMSSASASRRAIARLYWSLRASTTSPARCSGDM